MQIPQNLFHAIFSTMAEGVVYQEANGRIEACNASAERILGITADQMAGRTSLDPRWRTVHEDGSRFPGETHPAMVTLQTGQPLSNVIMGVHKPDGSLSWISINSRAVSREGAPVAVVTTFNDVTSQKAAEHAFRTESEERYRALFERSLECVYLLDLDGNFLDANHVAMDLLQYRREDLATLRLDSLLSGEQLSLAFQTLEEIRATGGQQKLAEFRLTARDGREVFLETQGSLIYRNGNPYAILGTARDVTARKQAEDSLRREQEFTRKVIDSIPGIFFVLDRNHRYVRWNRTHEIIFGVPPEQIPALDALERIVEEDRPKVQAALDEVLSTGAGVVEARGFIGMGPAVRDFLLTGHRLELDGQVYTVGFGIDITERKQATLQLEESQAELAAAQRIAEIGSWSWDVATGEARWSDETFRQFGLHPEPVKDGTVYLTMIHPEDRDRVSRALGAALEGTAPYDLEFRIPQPDGSLRVVHAQGEVVRNTAGMPVAMRGTMHDITGRKKAEDDLAATNARLSLAVASGGLGIWEWSIASDTLVWDERMLEIYGIPRRDFRGCFEDWRRALHPDDRAVAIEAFEAAIRGGRKYDAEFRIVRPDGLVRHIRADGTAVLDSDGKAIQMIGLNRDVTEQRRLEENLRESEYWLRESQRVSHIGSYVMEVEKDSWISSPGLDEIFGIDAGFPRTTAGWGAILHPDDRVSMLTYLREEVFGRGQKFDREYRIVRRSDGAIRWVHGRGALVSRPTDRITVMTGTIQDITERKQAELALRLSEDRYHAMFEQAGDGLVILDQEGRITSVNKTFADMHGCTVEEVLQLGLEALDVEGTTKLEDRLRRVNAGETLRFEVEHCHGDGHKFPLAVSANLISVGGQRMILATHRDISERKQAEAEREKLWTQLAQAQKMESIGRLAGGVAHDFNNLLTVINGYSRLVLGHLSANGPHRNWLEEVLKAGERAAGLTRQLLTYSRKQVLQPQVLSLNKVIEELQAMLRRLVGEDVDLRLVLSSDDPVVKADPHHLEQLIMNLAVNARDAMPHGGRLLIETGIVERGESSAAQNPDARPGCYALLAISDTGVGMDEATQKRIFEPFFTTKAAGQGTGLGLSMVQGIVAQSGGYVNTYSELGRGTTFRIYLPTATETREETEAPPALVRTLRGNETILVVEDQTEVRDFVVAVLKSYGYHVMQAATGSEALWVFEREGGRIDLVLSDVVMPNMSGRQLIGRFIETRPDIKVLFMSGYTDNVIVHHGVLDERVHLLQKPFTPEELAGKVRMVLGPSAPAGRILVADDESGVRSFLRNVLEEAGYEVVEASEGENAVQQAQERKVELVITDLVMPGREGIETIRSLRRLMPGVGIVAMSGAFEGQFLKVAQLLGADAVLDKPVTPDLLLTTVAKVLLRVRS